MKGKVQGKGKLWKWLVGIAMALICVVTAGLVVKVNSMEKTKEVSATFGYEQGLLAADGSEKKGTTSFRTKDYIPTDGLIIDIKDDASVTYVIYFYDAEKNFLSASGEKATDFNAEKDSVPSGAKYVRLMITPENDPEVSSGEIAGYAKELTVEYKKQ